VAKYSPRTTAGELQKIVESRVHKTFKKYQKAPTSPRIVWEGFKKIILTHPKTISCIFSYKTPLELQMGLGSISFI